MSLFIVLSPTVGPRDISEHTEQLEQLHLDYPDLLQLALNNWGVLADTNPENRLALQAALESHFTIHHPRRLRSYAHMQAVVNVVQQCLGRFYDDLQHQLGPILDDTGMDVQVSLHRLIDKDIMVRLEKP
ncbi:hypothetical protein LUCX_51 [Xanthomonas phage vB_XciM_LucasX]|nr:hypothetical protein LUCX_51 [Xanthomonas phage vB_XciM_LucasX]